MARTKYHFTKKMIEDLPAPTPPRKEDYYFDSKTRGLCLLISYGGAKSFYVRRKANGKCHKVCLGRFPELSIEQARAKAIEFNFNVANGNDPAEEKRAEKNELTVFELFQLYLERHVRKSRKRPEEIERNFQNWFIPWKDRKLSSIKRQDVEALHTGLAQTRGAYAANRSVQLLCAMYNKANLWELWNKPNPARCITRFPERSRDRFLREDEVDKFFAALEQEPKDNFYDAIMVLILTGQRKTNVLSMRWDDIDFTARTWTIPGEQTKNGRTMTIALTETELAILNRRLPDRENGYVFPSKGGLGYYREPKRRWHHLLRRAQMTDFRIHDLRRTLASYMVNTGANVALIQSALNHKDLQTTLKVYAKTGRRAEMEAREKAHDLMFDLAAGRLASDKDSELLELGLQAPFDNSLQAATE